MTTTPAESAVEDIRDASLDLLPPGRAYNRDADGELGKLIEALSVEPARIFEDGELLHSESVPSDSTLGFLLAEWERVFGLPDECGSLGATEAARQAALLGLLRGRAGHAQSVYESVAAGMGYDEIEFRTFAPFTVGTSGAGDALTGDDWSNVVQVCVLTGDQLADDQLVCALDDLRRAHGYLDIRLEGPMGAERTYQTLYSARELGGGGALDISDDTLTDITAGFPVKFGGDISLQFRIDDGSGDGDGPGAAMTSTPQGTWKLYASSNNGTTYSPVDTADTALLAAATLADDAVIDVMIPISHFPGTLGKLLYVPHGVSPGGGGDEVCTVDVATW